MLMVDNYSLSEYLKTLFLEGGGKPVIFSTIEFWLLFIVIIAGLSFFRRNNTMRLVYIFVFSLFFYYKANGILIFMMLATSMTDWLLSRQIARIDSGIRRKILFGISLFMNLILLVYFKYSVFVLSSLNGLFDAAIPLPDIILPIGISFYTFQSIAYMTDVYRRTTAPASRWLDYMFFITFFPLLLAGPIMRAGKFLPQIERNPSVTGNMIWSGFWLLLLGVLKKSVVADYIMQFNSWVFDSPADYSGLEILFATIGYSAQIYCDFSGYSDMAIGVGAIMGYDLGVNFDRPYRSVNITDFWRRWHISLSSWLRDYLYIPMGGNRKGKPRMYVNLFVTMLIAGIWHGASWLFVVWGALHGIGLVVNKFLSPYMQKTRDGFVSRLAGGIITFSFVTLLWPLFACKGIPEVCSVYNGIFTSVDLSYLWPFVEARPLWTSIVLMVFVSQMIPSSAIWKLRDIFVSMPLFFKLVAFVAVVQLVVQFSEGNVAPFIYLQF